MAEYPKMLVKYGPPLNKGETRDTNTKFVENAEQEAEARAKGWEDPPATA